MLRFVATILYVLAAALAFSAPMSTAVAANNNLDVDIQVSIDNRSTTTLSADHISSNFGNPVTFTATVLAVQGVGLPLPTGTVTFTIDGLPQTPVGLSLGLATLTTSNLSVGTHVITAHYSGDTEILSSDATPIAELIVDGAPVSIISEAMADPTTGVVGQPVTFTFVVTGGGVTFKWDFGDGATLDTAATTATHIWTAPGVFTVKVTATDAAGQSVSSSISFTVIAAVTPPGGLCDGFTPGAMTKLRATARLKLPSVATKDTIGISAVIQLPDGFNPTGKTLQWVIGGIQGQAVLTATGASKPTATTKASIRFKKPKKGKTFKASPGSLSISLKSISLATLQLTGVAKLNENSAKTGDKASLNICVLFNNANAYTGTASGLYKAKLNKTGGFTAK